MNWKTFFICGLTGWCMEILFTSLGGLLRGDLLLNGHTSIWMFPIYGLAAVIGPLSVRLRHWPVLLRGCFYGAGIMLVEFISGSSIQSIFRKWENLLYGRCRRYPDKGDL